jgi:flagellar hook-basal body complex protein FliE
MSAWDVAAMSPASSVSAVAVLPQAPLDVPDSAAAPANGAANAFAELLQQGLQSVGQDMQVAEHAMTDLAAGKPVELHDVMISLERARISVQTFVQVRNKLVEAYQDLMRMQL